MLAVRTLFSCFGLFVLAFFVTTFFWGAAGYYATRSIAAEIDSEYADDGDRDRERDEWVERRAEYERRAERRESIRVDSRSARPMQRARPMVDPSNRH